MTAKEIRDAAKLISAGMNSESGKAGTIHVSPATQAFFLGEIAAQLAELNETLKHPARTAHRENGWKP